MAEPGIIFYGANWCGDCTRARRYLDLHQIVYTYINIDKDPEAERFVLQTNRGNRSIPTILFADGSTLTEPSNFQLGRKLGVTA